MTKEENPKQEIARFPFGVFFFVLRISFGFRASCFVLLLALTGCHTCPKNRPDTYYAGPTEPLETVVERINVNNAKLPTLWASLSFREVTVVDEKKRERRIPVDGGTLMYRSPTDFYMLGDNAMGPAFKLATNAQSYYVMVKGDVDTLWWGWTRNVGSPCAQSVPIDPTVVGQVLGIDAISPNLLNQPMPVLRFNNDAGGYVVTWHVRAPNQWAAVKEVWYDHDTFLPFRVYLYGDRGRALVRADLSAHQPVKTEKGDDTGAKVATLYDLSFPDTGSRMILRLNDPQLSRKGFPKDGSFDLPPLEKAGVAKVIQVDEACP
jgi:hypothetical protein